MAGTIDNVLNLRVKVDRWSAMVMFVTPLGGIEDAASSRCAHGRHGTGHKINLPWKRETGCLSTKRLAICNDAIVLKPMSNRTHALGGSIVILNVDNRTHTHRLDVVIQSSVGPGHVLVVGGFSG